jgi:hypothetical protein
LHVQGKTDEAKSDLARLAKIRAEREAVAAKRKAEAEGEQSTYPLTVSCVLTSPVNPRCRESQGGGGPKGREGF